MAGFGSGFEPGGGGGKSLLFASAFCTVNTINVIGSVWQLITFDTFNIGTLAMWDAVNKRLRCTVTGLYEFYTCVQLENLAGGTIVEMASGKNSIGAPDAAPINYVPYASTSVSYAGPAITRPVTLSAGDYINVFMWHNGTVGRTRGAAGGALTYGIASLRQVG